MTKTEIEKKEENETHRPFLLTLYVSIISMIFVLTAICVHYGWMTLREDSYLTVSDYIYMCMLACGIITSINVSTGLSRYDNLHPAFLNGIRLFNLIIMIVCVISLMDIGSEGEPDWIGGGIFFAVMCVVLILYFYWLKHKNKDGLTNEERMVKKSKEKNKAIRIRHYDEREVLQSRTDIGLPNPGWAETRWDGRTSYFHVRNNMILFCITMGIISVLIVVGKHLNDVELQTGMFLICYLLGCMILRWFIFYHINYAVTHNAIHYDEGVRYKLLAIMSYSLVSLAIYGIVFEDPSPVWGAGDYVMTVVTYIVLFISTFLAATMGNKNKGHDFAFFDMDGYEKKKIDPRTEEENEKKD